MKEDKAGPRCWLIQPTSTLTDMHKRALTFVRGTIAPEGGAEGRNGERQKGGTEGGREGGSNG